MWGFFSWKIKEKRPPHIKNLGSQIFMLGTPLILYVGILYVLFSPPILGLDNPVSRKLGFDTHSQLRLAEGCLCRRVFLTFFVHLEVCMADSYSWRHESKTPVCSFWEGWSAILAERSQSYLRCFLGWHVCRKRSWHEIFFSRYEFLTRNDPKFPRNFRAFISWVRKIPPKFQPKFPSPKGKNHRRSFCRSAGRSSFNTHSRGTHHREHGHRNCEQILVNKQTLPNNKSL